MHYPHFQFVILFQGHDLGFYSLLIIFFIRLFAGLFWSVWSTSWTLDAVIRPSWRLFQTNELLWGKVDFSINLICSGQSFNSCTDFTSFSVWWYFWSRGLFGERIHYNQQIKLIPQVLICLEFDSTFPGDISVVKLSLA